jgi:hypothetical protein
MIVIEGLDGSGKTHLARRLARDLNSGRCHFDGPPENIREWKARCNQSAIWFQKPVIQDRTPFISELVYGWIEGRDPYIDVDTTLRILRAAAPIIIYCRPDRFIHNPNESESLNYLELLKSNWAVMLSTYDSIMVRLHAIRYDWTREALDHIAYSGIVELCKVRFRQAGFSQDR